MEIYQHFRPEEKPFIDEVLGWLDQVKGKYVSKRSDFLDPRQQDIVMTVIGHDPDVTLSLWGGASSVERKRLLLLPPYQEPVDDDYGLALFELSYPRRFALITHPDLLGAIMSLGVKREKFGDLLLKDSRVQLIVADEIASYIYLNLTNVGNSPVSLKEIPSSEIMTVTERWEEQRGTVSSLRLDTVVAEIYKYPRGKITPLIQKKRIKVNWKVVDQPSFLLKEGDYLSVRGMRRSKLISVPGRTKKGKWQVIFGKLARK